MQVIILLHGALGSSTELIPVSTALTAHNFRTHPFAFSGHGGKGFEPLFGIPQFTSELNEFIAGNNLHSATVFGYSMGGYVALLNAALNNQFTGKIVSLGTKFNWSEETVEKETKLLHPVKMEENFPAFARTLRDKHGDSWSELVIKTAAMMNEAGEKQFLNKNTFAKIKNHVLICRGENDQMVTERESRTASYSMHYASFYTIPGAKHQLESVNEKVLSGLILNFIQSTNL